MENSFKIHTVVLSSIALFAVTAAQGGYVHHHLPGVSDSLVTVTVNPMNLQISATQDDDQTSRSNRRRIYGSSRQRSSNTDRRYSETEQDETADSQSIQSAAEVVQHADAQRQDNSNPIVQGHMATGMNHRHRQRHHHRQSSRNSRQRQRAQGNNQRRNRGYRVQQGRGSGWWQAQGNWSTSNDTLNDQTLHNQQPFPAQTYENITETSQAGGDLEGQNAIENQQQSRPVDSSQGSRVAENRNSLLDAVGPLGESAFVPARSAFDYLSSHGRTRPISTENSREQHEFGLGVGETLCEVFGKHLVKTNTGGRCM